MDGMIIEGLQGWQEISFRIRWSRRSASLRSKLRLLMLLRKTKATWMKLFWTQLWRLSSVNLIRGKVWHMEKLNLDQANVLNSFSFIIFGLNSSDSSIEIRKFLFTYTCLIWAAMVSPLVSTVSPFSSPPRSFLFSKSTVGYSVSISWWGQKIGTLELSNQLDAVKFSEVQGVTFLCRFFWLFGLFWGEGASIRDCFSRSISILASNGY